MVLHKNLGCFSLRYLGDSLPKNGEEDDRELTKWIGTPEGTAYYKIDGVTRSVQKLIPKYEVKLGKKYIKIDNSRTSYEHMLEWFRNIDDFSQGTIQFYRKLLHYIGQFSHYILQLKNKDKLLSF